MAIDLVAGLSGSQPMKTMTQQIDPQGRRRRARRTAIILAVVAFAIYIANYLEHIFF